MKNKLLLLAFFLIVVVRNMNSFGQTMVSLTGTISDSKSGERVPFAVISLKNRLVGTNSNENGEFSFYIPKDVGTDSIIISCLGYKSKAYDVQSVFSPINVKLETYNVALPEVVIRALSPSDYIRLAMRKVKSNYPQKPFQTHAYYREQVNENNNLIKQTEAVFQTYYPSYQDTIKNQHQLLLYQKADEKKIEFMREQAERRKDSKNKKSKNPNAGDHDYESVKIGLGGPEMVLNLDFIKDKEAFLDSTQFKKFNYSFAGSSSYQGKELMIINFEARKKVEQIKPKGKIYIDIQSLAIAGIDYKADFEMPLLIRPLLFLYGLSINDATFEKKLQYHELNGKWYPKDFQWTGSGGITKKHLFKPNQHSDFVIEQLFFVNNLQTENYSPIPESKRFKSEKKIDDQVYNEKRISWSEINKVQDSKY